MCGEFSSGEMKVASFTLNTVNVDWFQPFTCHSDYSVGVIHFVVINLPHSERFKLENVLLGGGYSIS